MGSTKEVFALRKEGNLDQALTMVQSLYADDPNDEWVIKAYGWCLYDKIKILVQKKDYENAKRFVPRLSSLNVDPSDDILYSSIQRVILSVDPNRAILAVAKTKSEAGEHSEALKLYKEAKLLFPEDIAIDEAIGWELYRSNKTLFSTIPFNIQEIKKVLVEYINLKNKRPSLIHSLILGIADKIIENDQFNILSFLKLWDLNNLAAEDFTPNEYNGKLYPSRAEKVIQHSSKIISKRKLLSEIEYFFPFLEKAILKFPENIWLPYYKVKFLQLEGKNDDALKFVTPIVKAKNNDFWTWALLGELYYESDLEMSISCFCRALTCPAEESFIINSRIRLAQQLLKKNHFNEAKYEITRAIQTKTAQGLSLGSALSVYSKEEWFITSSALKSNAEFYKSNIQKAEEILFKDLPWMDGCLLGKYTTPEKPNKPRRKIAFKNSNGRIISFSVSEKSIKSLNNIKKGCGVRLKAESEKDGKFKLFTIENRDSQPYDIIPTYRGNITGVDLKEDKSLERLFITVLEETSIEALVVKDSKIVDLPKINIGESVYVKFVRGKSPDKYDLRTMKIAKGMPDILSIWSTGTEELFDLFPTQIAVISYHNKEKNNYKYINENRQEGFFNAEFINEKLIVGDLIKIRCQELSGDNGKYLKLLTCEKTGEEPKNKLVRSFRGDLEIHSGFGICDDVFISKDFIDKFELKDGSIINGKALTNYNRKKGKWGWMAISIEVLI